MAVDMDTPSAPEEVERVVFRRSLTARFVLWILLISLVTGGLGLVVFELIAGDVRETLGRDFVGKQALYDKSRLELPIQREVALALKLASSPALRAWSRSESDPALRARGLAELESFRQAFRDESYFFVPQRSLHFYYCDAKGRSPGEEIAYTLERGKAKDKWYFTTIAHPQAFSLNVDYDEKLEVTKLWINTNIRDGGETLGVVGTGFDLTSFIEAFVETRKPGVTQLLLDESGAIQAHADPAYIDENSQTKAVEDRKTIFLLMDDLEDRAAFGARLERLVSGESLVETLFLNLEGKPVLVGICYLPELRWFNVTAIEVNSLASTRVFFPLVVLLGSGLLAIVLAVLVLLRRIVLRPLSDLARSTASVVADPGEVRPDAEGGGGLEQLDEIGQLMESFSRMRNTVRETLSGMEDKVRARTAELEAARRLAEEANRAKGQFLANTSHELRTPMNAVLGMIQLVLDSELTAQQRSDLTNATGAARSLLVILNDLLDFSKIEAGKLTVESQDVPFESLLRSVALMTTGAARAKGLDLVFRVDPSLPEAFVGDVLRVRQVLLNLIGNAIKFTERGEVVVSVAFEPGHQETVRFSVRDTGIGIAEEERSVLFQPFTQADPSTTRRFGGTGLGLTITRSLVELMGGVVSLQSELGVGSELAFSLPLGRLGAAPAVRLVAGFADRSVLVVERNRAAREALGVLLGALGLGSRLASTVEEADALLAGDEAPPAVIVFDWGLRKGDSAQAPRRLVEAAGGERVAALVALTYDPAEASGDPVGLGGVLAKPVLPGSLAEVLSGVLLEATARERVPGAPALGARPLPSLEAIRGARLLLVEDNRVNQQIVLRVLRARGVEVVIAEDGVEALERLDETFDGVLMDLQMPRMNGYEAAREMRKQFAPDVLPIIAMSANAMESDRRMSREAGMNGHVSKPVDFAVFFRTLLTWVRAPGEKGGEVGEVP